MCTNLQPHPNLTGNARCGVETLTLFSVELTLASSIINDFKVYTFSLIFSQYYLKQKDDNNIKCMFIIHRILTVKGL